MKSKLWGLLIGLVLTVLFTFPLLTNFSSHLPSRQDGVLISWLINWGSRSLLANHNFFNPPFFHPYQNTINYSDLFFSTGVFNLPLIIGEKVFLNTEPNLKLLIINHNFHLFVGSIMVFWSQYLLGLYLFKAKKLAILGAIIFAFSSMHFNYLVHLQSFLIAGIPLYFLFLFKFIDTKKQIFLLLTSLAVLYQFLNSPMSGLFLIIMSFITLANKKVRVTLWQNRSLVSLYILGLVLLIGFFYYPYFIVSQQFNYTRTIRDTAHFAFSLNKFLLPEIIFYFGLIIVLIKRKKEKLPHYFWLFLSFTVLGALLMLGPVIKVNDQTFKVFNLPIPLPYVFFYYLFPGFKAFRASSRWILVFTFGLSIVISYLIKNIKLNKKVNKDYFINSVIIIITAMLWITQVPQLKTYPINTTLPPIYKVIKQQPETVLAEFPTYVWSQYDNYYREADRLLYQSYHQKKLYNGFSGFAPPERETLWSTISDHLDQEKNIKHLKDSGVELVLLRGDENPTYQNFSSPHYKLITCKNQDCLYHLQ